MVPTDATSRPMRASVSSRSSRMSGSSSTTRTWAAVLFIWRVSSGERLPAQDAGMGTGAVVHVLERRAVGGAELAREVETEARALRFSGEERLEELPLARRRHARAVVDHGELDATGIAAKGDAHRALLRAGVARGIAQEVPHHLAQMLAVELDPGVRAHVDREALGGGRLVGDELGEELAQPGMQPNRAGRDAVAPVELQHVGHQPLQAPRVVLDDAGEARRIRVLLLLVEQL